MDVTLREGVLADADELGALHVACWREAYFPHLLSEASFAVATPKARADRWRSLLPAEPGLAADPVHTWVAEMDGALIGFAGAGSAPDGILELYSIYVVQRAHGTGVGQQLLERALGNRAAQLWVAEQNPRARAFYERNGFVLTGERKIDTFILDEIAELRMARS